MPRKFLDNCLFSVKVLFKQKGRLAFETRYDYVTGIRRMMRELHQGGFMISNIHHLKEKHINYLLGYWEEKGLSNATIKNNMSQIRYILPLIRKPDLIPKSNEALGIGKRSYISKVNKAIHDLDVSKFSGPLIPYSVQLQQHFGLRREESIKFIVGYADKGDHIRLKESWTKGGIARLIPVVTLEQRALLDEIRMKVGLDKSLIPDDKSYAYQRKVYEKAVQSAGYHNLHGLRHAYAQKRYFDITNHSTNGHGWHAPINGGKHRKDLLPHSREIDDKAREIISRELGHARVEISSIYCGV
jgi:hypothetical protein